MTGRLRLGLVRPAEAIAWAKRRAVVLPEIYYGELMGLARAEAFTVSGLASVAQIKRVLDSLIKATNEGTPFGAWKEEAAQDDALASLPHGRLETIFRNATQTHYQAGRWRSVERGSAQRPYLMYSAINDTRTRPAHLAMHGFIARVDDPIWERWMPPNGHGCRCSTIQLSEGQALARGYGEQETPDAEPDPGWDHHPVRQPEALRQVLTERMGDLPDPIARALARKVDEAMAEALRLGGAAAEGGAEP